MILHASSSLQPTSLPAPGASDAAKEKLMDEAVTTKSKDSMRQWQLPAYRILCGKCVHTQSSPRLEFFQGRF